MGDKLPGIAPDWFRPAMEDAWKAAQRAQVEAMPRIRFVFGRDYFYRDRPLTIGVCWDRNFDAEPGEYIYRRRVSLRVVFRLWFEKI